MATTSLIVVEGFEEIGVYKHYDGYQSAMMPWLMDFHSDFMKNIGWNPSYELAQLLKNSARKSKEYLGLDEDEYFGWGIVRTSEWSTNYKYVLCQENIKVFKYDFDFRKMVFVHIEPIEYKEKEEINLDGNKLNDCNYLLTAVVGGTPADFEILTKVMAEFEIDAEDVVEDVKGYTDVNIESMFSSTYSIHARKLKEQISELCEDLANEDSDINFDSEKFDNYEVIVYPNSLNTQYDCDNDLWGCKDIDEIKKECLSDLVDFLIDKQILQVKNACRKVCIGFPEPEDLDEDDYKDCLEDCNESGAVIEYLKKIIV